MHVNRISKNGNHADCRERVKNILGRVKQNDSQVNLCRIRVNMVRTRLMTDDRRVWLENCFVVACQKREYFSSEQQRV